MCRVVVSPVAIAVLQSHAYVQLKVLMRYANVLTWELNRYRRTRRTRQTHFKSFRITVLRALRGLMDGVENLSVPGLRATSQNILWSTTKVNEAGMCSAPTRHVTKVRPSIDSPHRVIIPRRTPEYQYPWFCFYCASLSPACWMLHHLLTWRCGGLGMQIKTRRSYNSYQ